MSVVYLKQYIQVLLAATVSVFLLTAPLYAVDLPHGLASLNAVVDENIAETRRLTETLNAPPADEENSGHARVYFPDRPESEAWEAIPTDAPVRFHTSGNELVWNNAGGAGSLSVAGVYSGGAAVELEAGRVYVASYVPREPLLSNPAKVAGYTPPPTEGDIELLPETEERVAFDDDRMWGGVGIGLGGAFLIASAILGGDVEDTETALLAGLVGGLFGSLLGFHRTQQESPDNIAENTRRRRELEREQQQILSHNDELLESANEEIREQNSQLGYILIEEMQSGRTTHLWVSE